MLQIPQWTAAIDRWDRSEVIGGRRRTHRPFESPSVPGVIPCLRPLEIGESEVRNKYQYGDALNQCADGDQQVQRIPAAAGLEGINTSRHAEYAGNVHEIKGEVKPDDEQPEMNFSERFVQHPSRNFWVPIIKCCEQGEENSAYDHVVKMRDHKVGIAELPVERCDSQHDAGKAGNQKLKQESDAE